MPWIERKSNIELARVIAMVLITAHHCIYHSNALSYVEGFNRDVAYFWLWGGKTGVNVFVLISSFFLLTKKSTFSQFVRVWCTALFYYSSIILFTVFVLRIPVSRSTIIRNFLPVLGYENWYVSTFCIWLLLVPVLNQIIMHLDSVLIHTITGILFLLECILPMMCETHYYTDLLFFIFLYFLMLEYRIGNLNIVNNKGLCWIVLISSIAVIFLTEKYTGITSLAMNQYSLFTLLIGLSIFSLCLNCRPWYSRSVNLLGKTTFGIFLLHTANTLRRDYLWPQVFQCNLFFYSRWYWLWILLCVFVIFIVGFILEILRIKLLEEPLQHASFYQRFIEWGESFTNRLLDI